MSLINYMPENFISFKDTVKKLDEHKARRKLIFERIQKLIDDNPPYTEEEINAFSDADKEVFERLMKEIKNL